VDRGLQHPIGSGMQPCRCAPSAGGGGLAFDSGGGGGGGKVLTTGVGACASVGFGIVSVSVCPPFCNFAALRSTDCKIQPL
jgi:hypothetical protein